VELGFSCLERDATEPELRRLVAAAGDTARVHVILSANVFVAPLRALAIARAASTQVTVRPTPRDPTLTRALVDAVGDDGIQIVGERDIAVIDAGEIHVYGRDETIAAVRASAAKGVVVRGHGVGLGVAVVTRAADLRAAAEALAADVVTFDQRGCLSPRIAIVEGDVSRAETFALVLHGRMGIWGEPVASGPTRTTPSVSRCRGCR
jgi:acyl-CoA reductase-like NAD-dependent aldehyde dehydrogenase